MKLQKSQLKVILLLNTILLILVCAIAFEALTDNKSKTATNADAETEQITPTPTPTPKEEYTLIRFARPSLSEFLSLETNIGGSENEYLVDAFTIEDKLYVFGNTTSSDFDMTSSETRPFLAVLNADLATEKFCFLGNSGEILESVTLGEGGFVGVFSILGRLKIANFDYDGEILSLTSVKSSGSATFSSLYTFENKYALISTLRSSSLAKGRLLLSVYDLSLNLSYERLISSPYSLEFLALYEVQNEYTLFFRASSDLGTHAGVALCKPTGEPSVFYINNEDDYVPFAVTPYMDGFALSVITNDGEGVIFLLDYSFKKQNTIHQCKNAQNGIFLFSDGTYYCGFGGDKVKISAYNTDFTSYNSVERLSLFDRLLSFHTGNDYCLFAFSSNDTVRILDGNSICDLTILISPISQSKILRLKDNFYFICDLKETTADARGNFGGSDIWICKLRI